MLVRARTVWLLATWWLGAASIVSAQVTQAKATDSLSRAGALAIIAWLAGAAASATGLLISFHYDLPTGPIVVCMFGLLLLIAYGLRRVSGAGAAVVEPPSVGEAA